jgi:OOP family OmpA-OmpF porin
MSSAIRIILAGIAAAAALLPAVASAQGARSPGYLYDSRGNVVKAPVAGVCVRTSQWTPAVAIAECDPDLIPKPAPAAKPAPAPAKPAEKPKPKPKPTMINIEEKIELQGMPFNKAEMTEDNKKELDAFLG